MLLILLKLVNKADYNAKVKDIKDKITGITNLATTTGLNAKINEVKGEIPSAPGLATTPAFTAVESKIPERNTLVEKVDFDVKISDFEKNYFTTSDYNKFTNNILD